MRTSIIILIIWTFFSCSRTADNINSETNTPVTSEAETSPETTILNFLKWYKDNGTNLAIDLVSGNSGGEWDSTKFYAVNFPATEKYLKTLTETGMLSNKYADKWRDYFKKCDKQFKDQPQNDGPPEGFEYDFVLFSQEDPGLSELDKIKFDVLKKDANLAQIQVNFPSDYHYNYHLSKRGQHWTIDNIEPVFK